MKAGFLSGQKRGLYEQSGGSSSSSSGAGAGAGGGKGDSGPKAWDDATVERMVDVLIRVLDHKTMVDLDRRLRSGSG